METDYKSQQTRGLILCLHRAAVSGRQVTSRHHSCRWAQGFRSQIELCLGMRPKIQPSSGQQRQAWDYPPAAIRCTARCQCRQVTRAL